MGTTRDCEGKHPPEPSGNDCEANVRTRWRDQETMAAWYPQMGGYVGKAVLVRAPAGPSNVCLDVYVWHDGEFPFSDEGHAPSGGDCPVRLHHCMAEQFITFGETALAFQEGGPEQAPHPDPAA